MTSFSLSFLSRSSTLASSVFIFSAFFTFSSFSTLTSFSSIFNDFSKAFVMFSIFVDMLHTLRYFYTASSDVPNFPEFVVVGYVDDVQIIHYDSNNRTAVPKQDWMKDITDQQYWKRETGKFMDDQQRFKDNIEIAKQRFNQTGGVHIGQYMYGCEWDDETGDVDGYDQYGYDGEDFISLNLKKETWIAAKQQAFITKVKWDHDMAMMSDYKYYYTQICPDWLKKYVNAGRSSLMRTDLPSIKLLQRTPSSPVTCHATGFYPRYAVMFWRKDQEEVFEGVDHGEMLPNHDGSFQMSVDLNISLIRAEDWSRYDCVFQLKGVEEDLTVTLDKSVILSNWRNFTFTLSVALMLHLYRSA
uniref:Ig-like domain-containing protein n=1 Tax=Gouania willdenowi TaxID=441366 RepID=A0A8C5GMZ2_GOUWI